MRSGEVVGGKYRLCRVLGTGGMGEVWAAVHAATDREFAIKFLHARVASTEGRARFTREAKASARINHPNIIDVFDVGETDDGGLYLVMEVLDGMPLSDALLAVPPLSVQDFLAVMLDSARALVAAHAAGIVHRDIKPANIFLHKDRGTGLAYAKLLDFGVSKFSANEDSIATKTGSILGSPRYMSPEQARSAADADHRADLWAMGVILFEGLTGLWPHEGDSFSSLVIAIAMSPPRDIDTLVPGAPAELRAIVKDCLKPLGERLATAEELVARLERVLEGPSLASIPLPRPLAAHTGESKISTGGLRVRPATLSTNGHGGHPSRYGSSGASAGRAMLATEAFPSQSGALTTTDRSAPSAPLPRFVVEEDETTNTTRRAPLGAVGASSAHGLAPVASGRADGLTESVSAMNLEKVVRPGLEASQPGSPSPIAAGAPLAMTPVAPSGGSKLGLVAAALAVLAVGLGIAIVAALRSSVPVSTGSERSTASVASVASVAPAGAASVESAAPSESAAPATVDVASSAAPSASASAAPSASASASSAPAAEAPTHTARKHTAPHPAAPSKPKIEALGSGL